MFRLLFIIPLLLTSLFSNEIMQGFAKRDVNVRSLPDYESKVAYVLKKNEKVKILSTVKTKNKGIWYELEKGFVVTRFIEVQVIKQEPPKKIEVEEKTAIEKPKKEEIVETKQEAETLKTTQEKTEQVKVQKEPKQEITKKEFVEPLVIKKEESFFDKYINIDYVFYGMIGIVLFVLFLILFIKIFSRPSISQQVEEQKRMRDSLKKVLANKDEEEQPKE